MINTNRLILGVELISNLVFGDNTSQLSYSQESSFNRKDYVFRLRSNLSVAYSFPAKTDALISFVPKLVLRFHQDLGVNDYDHFTHNSPTHQASLDFRVWDIIFGTSNGWKNTNYQNHYIGYKTTKIKLTFGTKVISSDEQNRLDKQNKFVVSEIAVSYLF